jgi:hypothetical protein
MSFNRFFTNVLYQTLAQKSQGSDLEPVNRQIDSGASTRYNAGEGVGIGSDSALTRLAATYKTRQSPTRMRRENA